MWKWLCHCRWKWLCHSRSVIVSLQVEVTAERDPSRLLRPTEGWIERQKVIGPSGSGPMLNIPHRFRHCFIVYSNNFVIIDKKVKVTKGRDIFHINSSWIINMPRVVFDHVRLRSDNNNNNPKFVYTSAVARDNKVLGPLLSYLLFVIVLLYFLQPLYFIQLLSQSCQLQPSDVLAMT